MKKVKILLSALTVIAGVGGALAFKANKFTQANVYCSTFNSPTCQKQTSPNVYQTTVRGGAINFDPCGSDTKYYTEASCITTFTTTGQAVYVAPNQ